jgi:hypothetical protein
MSVVAIVKSPGAALSAPLNTGLGGVKAGGVRLVGLPPKIPERMLNPSASDEYPK